MGSLCNLTVDFSNSWDYEFYSYFSCLEWCELSKHYKFTTVGVQKFPNTMITSFFMDKSPRHTPIPKVTALYCFISILSYTTELLEIWASHIPSFGFRLCCHNFQYNRSLLDTNLYSCPPQKKRKKTPTQRMHEPAIISSVPS